MGRGLSFLRVTALALTALILAPGTSRAADEEKPPAKLEIEFIHTNDIHGYLKPGRGNKGGAGAIATLVDEARKRALTDKAYDVIVTDSGDLFDGGPEDNLSRGKMMTEFFTSLPYDAMVLGNHDFGYGLDVITNSVKSMRDAKVVVLGANVKQADGSVAPQLAIGSTVIQKRGVKIGLVGVTSPGTKAMNVNESVAGLDFPDPIPALKTEVEALRQKGVDVIVVLSHVGYDNAKYVDDKKMGAAVPELRAFIGGHTHKLLKTPIIEPTNKALIVSAGAQGNYVGRLTLMFDGKSKKPLDANSDGIVDHKYETVAMDPLPGAHPIAEALKAKYWDPVAAMLDENVGVAKFQLVRKFYKTESQLGNLVADALLAKVPGAQVALVANSEMRADLYPGDLSRREIFKVLPFQAQIVKMTVPGSVLKTVLEGCFDDGRHFAQVAGMQVRVDTRKPVGERVLEIKIAGTPLDPAQNIVIASTDFVAQGKGGFTEFQNPATEPTGAQLRDAMIEHLKRLGSVSSDSIRMGRIRDALLSEEVGRCTTTFGTDVDGPSPNLFDVVSHAMLGQPARGDLAIIDSSSIHWRLSDRYPVTRKDVIELVPFDNNLVTVKITGQQLLDFYKGLVAKLATVKRLKAWPAGASVVVDATGGFVMLIGDQPVDPKKTYTMALADHLLTGPKGFEMLHQFGLTQTPTGLKMRAALDEWIRKATPLGVEDFPERPTVVIDRSRSAARTAKRINRMPKDGAAPAAPVEDSLAPSPGGHDAVPNAPTAIKTDDVVPEVDEVERVAPLSCCESDPH